MAVPVSKVSVNPYSNLFHDTEGAMVHYDDQCYSSFTVACRFQIVLVRWMRLIKRKDLSTVGMWNVLWCQTKWLRSRTSFTIRIRTDI